MIFGQYLRKSMGRTCQGGKEGATVENFDQGEETRSGSSKEKQLVRVLDAWTALVVETQEPG